MKNWMTKKNVFMVSVAGSLFLGIAEFLWDPCYITLWCKESFYFTIFGRGGWLLFFPIFFVLTLITWKLDNRVFYSWIRFAYWWIPLSILIIFTTPTTDHSWALGGPTRETMSFVMSGLFFFISLILITYKHFTLKKTGARE